MRKLLFLLLLLFCAPVGRAQTSAPVSWQSGLAAQKPPTCQLGQGWVSTDTGAMSVCSQGAWVSSGSSSLPTTLTAEGVYTISPACGSMSNCLQLTDDDSTDNCGTPLTNFLNTINNSTAPGALTLNIYGGSVSAEAYKFVSCDLKFTRSITIGGAATFDCAQSSGDCFQIGPTGNTAYNLTYNATSAASVHAYIIGNFTWIDGANLTTAGIIVPPWQAYVEIKNQKFVNFGPGNATSGNCTAWAIEMLSLNNGLVADNEWLSWDSTAGRCAFESVESGSVSGQASVNFQRNALMAGGGPPCSSQGIYTAGNFWNISNNMIAGFGVDIRVGANNGDYGGLIEGNFFGNSCAAKSTTAYIWLGQNGESGQVVKGIEITGNDFQGNSGYGVTIAPDTSDTVDLIDFSRDVVTHGTMTVAPNTFNCANECFQDGLVNVQGGGLTALGGGGWDPPSHRLGTFNANAQTANISASTLLSQTFGGTGAGHGANFNIGCLVYVTSAGTTSTLPACQVTFTNLSGNVVTEAITLTNTGNSTSTSASGVVEVQAEEGTNIQISTTGYASTGTAMQYALRSTAVRTP